MCRFSVHPGGSQERGDTPHICPRWLFFAIGERCVVGSIEKGKREGTCARVGTRVCLERGERERHIRRMCTQCTQHVTLDECGVPWERSIHVGTVVAAQPTRAEDGDIGDGKFVWRWDDEKRHAVILPTSTPERSRQLQEEVERQRAQNARECAQAIAEYQAQRAIAEDGGGGADENGGGEEADKGGGEEADEEVVARAGGERERKSARTRVERKPRRSASAKDDEIIKTLVIEQKARPNGGRVDLCVRTPDGRTHRSKIAAIRHVRGDPPR